MFTQVKSLAFKTFLPAASFVVLLATAPYATAAVTAADQSPLTAEGVPSALIGGQGDVLGFASTLGGSERRDINASCEDVFVSPGSYDAQTVSFCHKLQVAESLAPRVSRDQDQ